MTLSPPPPPPPDPDELASAIVDGLLPPHEADAARRDPAVARRVEDILRVRAALRATPPPPPGSADRAVAAALAAFDDESASVAEHPPPPLRVVATSAGQSQPRKPPGQATAGRWLAAAAAIIVVGLVAAGLISQNATSNEGGDAATSAASSSESEEDSGAGSAEAPPTVADQTEAGGEGALTAIIPQLGDAADTAELEALVRTNLEAGEIAASQTREHAAPNADAPTDTTNSGVDEDEGTCLGLSDAGDPARGTMTFVADATLEGTRVRLHLYEQDGELQLVATDPSCTDLVVPFTG